jgi:dihydropteroate synthase
MVYRHFEITPEEALPATQVLHFKALQQGADMFRVHDVAEMARTVELYRILE